MSASSNECREPEVRMRCTARYRELRNWNTGTLIRLARSPDLTVVPDRTRVQRQGCVPLQVARNSRGRGGVYLHHLLVLLEHDAHDVVHEIARQIRVRHGEIVEAER